LLHVSVLPSAKAKKFCIFEEIGSIIEKEIVLQGKIFNEQGKEKKK
jgi:hypothetical protein